MQLSSGESQYTATVSLPMALYEKIFSAERNPVLEITTNKGNRGYARIGEPHADSPSTIFISPLVAMSLNVTDTGSAFLKLCSSLSTIDHVEFTFYGDQARLDQLLDRLITALPEVVEAFSYLSLGMVLNTQIEGEKIEVRVDGLTSDAEQTIFAGLLPFGISNITFDITPDVE
jgi:hypothetical protein